MPKPSEVKRKDKKNKKEPGGGGNSEDEFEFLNRDINGADFASLLDGTNAGQGATDGAKSAKETAEGGGDGQTKVDTEQLI